MVYNVTYQLLPNGKNFTTSIAYFPGEASGVAILSVASIVSLVAVLGLLTVLALSAFNTRFSNNDQLFVRTHVATYFYSLMFSEILLSIGSIMSLKWVTAMMVTFNEYCITQAIIKQVADVGLATWSLLLAIHTFSTLFLEWKPRAYARWLFLLSGWSFIGMICMLGPATVNRERDGRFHGIAGYWCWISPAYETQRLTLDYLMMFMSAGLSLFLYSLCFLKLRGNIRFTGWRISFHKTPQKQSWSSHNFNDKQLLVMARQMVMYPIAYTLTILPVAVTRFMDFAGDDIPFAATVFADTIYLLSGLVTVVLFMTNRRVLPARSVLKLVINKPPVQEPDWIDPDSYYPDMAEDQKTKDILGIVGLGGDVEKYTSHHDIIPQSAGGPPTARPVVTPIFKRTESYASEAEADSYSESRHSVEYENPHPLEPAVPQLTVRPPPGLNLSRISFETSSPEQDHHAGNRDSFYDYYGNPIEINSHQGGKSDAGKMHDVSLE